MTQEGYASYLNFELTSFLTISKSITNQPEMVQLIATPPLVSATSSEVDYNDNPTELFKFIQLKDWNMVEARVGERPEEASSWVTRRGKDGKIRWKILPLHAVLSIKAPKDVILPIINAYPEACSLADDQGMLPIHLIMKNQEADEEVIKIILQSYPSGVNAQNKEGKLPLGRPVLLALNMLKEMELEKIRLEERAHLESKLTEDRETKSLEIKQLKDQINQLKDVSSHSHQELEVRLTTGPVILEDESAKFKKMEEENQKRQEKIDSQSRDLALKEEQLKAALTKLTSQEDYIVKYRKMNKNDVCELGSALSNINDLDTQIFLLQTQLDTQSVELKRKNEECKKNLDDERVLLDDIEKIKESCNVGDMEVEGSMKKKLSEVSSFIESSQRSSLDKITKLVNDIIAMFKNQMEKDKAIEIHTGQETMEDDKDKEVTGIKNRYQEFLENITKLVYDIIAHFKEQMKKIKEKSNEMHESLKEMKDAGSESLNNKLRDFFEKIANATVDHLKHICKERGEKENALISSEEDECEKEDKCVEEENIERKDKSTEEESIEKKDKCAEEEINEDKDKCAEEESNEEKDKCAKEENNEKEESCDESDSIQEDTLTHVGDAVKSDNGVGVLKDVSADDERELAVKSSEKEDTSEEIA